ncbi:GTPase-activating protein SEC23 [Sugiyamaella lignohabitans]|uniref:Protein transport protein SEC23 n=1 Tax=Sugiyamaella lignohabitans TaxID=796027 RepID=A0A170QYY7_9ASCO|nr:GTPase-activating protein SEC23 [Sugiyamaella lignohabitans]ANB15996.1 GTPase-activating protein SEC23 [Sugiyamaella lignohabitans]
MVYVHESTRSIAFNGQKNYTFQRVEELLGIVPADVRPKHSNQPVRQGIPGTARYFHLLQEFEYDITNILEQAQLNAFHTKHDNRQHRCTGEALNIAQSMLQSIYPACPARIMLFTAGPCTIGPGMVVEPSLREPLRSHKDIDSETAKYYKKAKSFYDGLANRAAHNGNVIDIFAGCYDQVGLDEMSSLASRTGGVIILSDSFATSIFKQSFIRMFNVDSSPEGYLEMGFLASLMVKMSKEIKVSGLLGHAISSKGKTPSHVAETEIGIGGTSSWRIAGLRPSSTYALFFDITNTQPLTVVAGEAYPQAYIQFSTHYLHSSGFYRLRVTTIARPFDISNRGLGQPGQQSIVPTLSQSFDQEAAIAILAKLSIYKAESGLPIPDLTRWIDATLIKLCIRFANYIKEDPHSFRLPEAFIYFPQFVYHLRRSQFLQVFNNSPDETVYYRHVLMQEDTTNCSIMVQPTLTAYEIDKDEPEPVLLDSLSVNPNRILLLDTFFHILIYHGETIAAWRKQKYQELPEYENFKQLLEAPRQDASALLIDRFPLPRFIDTEARGSQARFLFSRLNPSKSASDIGSPVAGAVVLTDDVSLQDFMEYLIKLCVSKKAENIK